MIGVGIVAGALGYTVFYYGAELWAGRAVSIASASGFAKPPAPSKSGGSSGIAGTLAKVAALSPLLFFI